MGRMFLLRCRSIAGEEGGSSLVEFAVSGVVMFMMMIGVMNMSEAVYTYHYVSEAAREGSRYAIVRGSSVSSPATQATIQTYVQNLGYPGINPSLMAVAASWKAYPSGTTCTPSSTCNNPGNLVTVKATYSYPLSIPYVGKRTLTMTSTSSMIISQ